MLRHCLPTCLLATAVVASACGGSEPAPPDTVRERLDTTLPGIVDRVSKNLDSLDASDTMESLIRGLEAMDGAWSGLPFDLAPPTDPDSVPGDSSPEVPSGRELAQDLTEALFNDDNYLGDGDYQIPADLVCDEEDAECAADMARAELVIHAAIAGDGLDFTLEVGPAPAKPATLELRSDRITVALDLAESARAAQHIASSTGETLELPERIEGILAATLRVTGQDAVRLELAVRDDLRVEGVVEGDAVSLSVASRDPILAVGFDSVSETITADVDLPRTRLQAPWQAVFDDSFATGALDIDWQGLSASIELREGDDTLTLGNLGLGDDTSAIRLDGVSLVTADLNADTDRRFDLTMSTDAGGMPVFSLNPGFDLALGFNLAPLAAAGDDVESYLLDETYRIAVTGDAPRLAPQEADDSGFGGGLAVLAGQLSVSSTAASAPIVVSAGQCLVGVDDSTSETHPILGLLAAGPCR